MKIFGIRILRRTPKCLKKVEFWIVCVVLIIIATKMLLVFPSTLLSNVLHRYLFLPYKQLWVEESDHSGSYKALPLPMLKKYAQLIRRGSSEPFTFRWFDETIDQQCFNSLPPHVGPSYFHNESFLPLKPEDNGRLKKILLWNYAFQVDRFVAFGHEPFQRACCKESRCYLAQDTSQVALEDFDAIIFHFYSLTFYSLPERRNRNQRWVFLEQESSAHSFQDPDIYSGVFNWTMTYRTDADIPTSYGHFFKRAKEGATWSSQFDVNRLIQGKRGIAAWFSSHCSTLSYREHYVRQLQNYIKVDVFGKCGNFSCPKTQGGNCYEMVEANYKFYLAFENSLCQDYVTEKFFHILRYNVVPVVFGFADYNSLAPPHSYIDILDFESIEQVAKYLIYLDGNDTAYQEYFRWKESFGSIQDNFINRAVTFCSLCQRLHSDSKEKHYDELRKWHMKERSCKRLRPSSWIEKLLGISLFNG